MFTISKERTPVLFQQSQAVQTLAQQFNSHYTSQKSVQVRQEWGKFLKQIQEGDLNCVNAKGESVQNENPRKATFEAICHELGISRSGGYTYINEYITAQTYPQVIRDAAAEAGLNLALPHIQAVYGEMTARGLPKDPSALELKGIIAELQDAKPNKSAKPTRSRSPSRSQLHGFAAVFVSGPFSSTCLSPGLFNTEETLVLPYWSSYASSRLISDAGSTNKEKIHVTSNRARCGNRQA